MKKIILIIFVVMFIASASWYLFLIKKNNASVLNDQLQIQKIQSIKIGDATSSLSEKMNKNSNETENWKTYINEEFGFSFQYPNQVNVLDNKKEIIIKDTQSYYMSEVRMVKNIKNFRWSKIGNVYYFDNNDNLIREGLGKTDPIFYISEIPVFSFSAGDAGSYFTEYGVVNFDKDEIVLFSFSFDSNSIEPMLAKSEVFKQNLNKIIKTISFK